MNILRRNESPESFDSFAADYERFCDFEDKPVWGSLAEAGVADGARALDAGCGAGRRCSEFVEHFDEVVGFDLSEPLIALARARRGDPRISYRTADLYEFDDPAGFDLVFSSTMLHHVSDLDKALHHLRSLVRPGGHVVLADCTSARPTPPRWAYQAGAVLALRGDIRRHGWRDALWLARFRTTGPWMAHLLSDVYLSREQFDQRYGAVFPGARFLDRAMYTMVWRAPG